jgi:NAD(P)-dependent dehydrogenase (short-subunit alcohol dehydrogenase family)
MSQQPVAIVTGAAQGIARPGAGWRARGHRRHGGSSQAVAELREVGFEVSGVIVDVADEASIQAMMAHAVATMRVEFWVNR